MASIPSGSRRAGAGRLGPRVNRALIGVSALALAAFGIWQLWLGVGLLPGPHP